MTNSQIKTLAIELYKLATNDDTISSEKAENLLKLAVTKDAKEKLNVNEIYSKYPQLKDRLTDDVKRYFELPYKNITVFTRGKLTFGLLYMNNESIDKLASFIYRHSGMIHKYEEFTNEFIWTRYNTEMHKSLTRVYDAFDDYIRNKYTEEDLIKRFENEFEFIGEFQGTKGMVD
jgi:hypothetical protein